MANKAELSEALDTLANAFGEFSTALKKADRKAWEQWKAGGYIEFSNDAQGIVF